MTIGELRTLLEGLPANTLVFRASGRNFFKMAEPYLTLAEKFGNGRKAEYYESDSEDADNLVSVLVFDPGM